LYFFISMMSMMSGFTSIAIISFMCSFFKQSDVYKYLYDRESSLVWQPVCVFYGITLMGYFPEVI
jgi:hypothetical protein